SILKRARSDRGCGTGGPSPWATSPDSQRSCSCWAGVPRLEARRAARNAAPSGPTLLASSASSALRRPLDLELDLLGSAGPLVLDAELGTHRHVNPLAGDLNLELLVRLERVCKPAQLRDELRRRIDLFDVPLCHARSFSNALYKYSARNRPVCDLEFRATSSGVPTATTWPPLCPPSGPRSITQSAVLMTSRLCSITTTVLPCSTSSCSTSKSFATSWKCRPVVGSSRISSVRPVARRHSSLARFTCFASPPEVVCA